MSDPDIFTAEKATEEKPLHSELPLADKLAGIKNENGEQKYKDVESALDALKASQEFIPTLLREKAEIAAEKTRLEKQLQEIGSVQDLIKNFSPNSAPPDKSTTPETTTVVSEETIVKTVQSALQAQQENQRREANLKSVVETVTKQFGAQAGAHIQKRATELGLSTDSLKEMASTSPSAALELLVPKTKSVVTPSQSSIIPPLNASHQDAYPTYEKGVTQGGLSNKELAERWRKSADYTNKRIGLDK